MDLLVGESLFDRLRREGTLRPEDVVRVLWQVCGGLEAAHGLGVVHRDLKPENVFLARSASGREVAKVLDFGIAKIADPVSGSSTQAGMVVGTPEYLAPEQASGGAVDGRADLYSVGLIGWRALTGRHPFSADDPRGLLMMQATQPVPPLTSARPELAAWPGLAATIARACEKDPAARHPTAGALRDDLAAALGTSFVAPPGATPAPPAGAGAPFAFTPAAPGARPARARATTLAATWTRASAAVSASLARRTRRVLAAARGRAGHLDAHARGGLRRAHGLLREHPGRAAALAAGAALAALVALAVLSHRGRPLAEARVHLADGRAGDARAVVEAALRSRPDDHALLLLRGRALHRIPGQIADGIDGYRAAREAGPLDAEALADLAAGPGPRAERRRSLGAPAARGGRGRGAGAGRGRPRRPGAAAAPGARAAARPRRGGAGGPASGLRRAALRPGVRGPPGRRAPAGRARRPGRAAAAPGRGLGPHRAARPARPGEPRARLRRVRGGPGGPADRGGPVGASPPRGGLGASPGPAVVLNDAPTREGAEWRERGTGSR